MCPKLIGVGGGDIRGKFIFHQISVLNNGV